MGNIKRISEDVITNHFDTSRQMIFLPGPRQVGKTTIAQSFIKRYPRALYLNWDEKEHREIIQRGSQTIANILKLGTLKTEKKIGDLRYSFLRKQLSDGLRLLSISIFHSL